MATFNKQLLAGACTALLMQAEPVFAQENAEGDTTDAEERTLNTVVVTGRLREENVQDVPISQTVFGAEQIQDARLDRVEDFIGLTPGVTISQAQNAGQSFIMIRGLTQVRNNEAPVAVVIDGALTASPNQLTRELFDVESIEVLRGPQGALYGRNATGGAIIINTKQPGDEFESYVRGGIASGEEYFVGGGVSGPLVENKLYGSLNAKYLDREGYYDNVTLNEKADFFDELAVAGKLRWEPNENFTANLRLNYIKNEGSALNVWFQPTILDANGNFAGFDFAGGPTVDTGGVGGDVVQDTFYANNRSVNERDIFEATLKLEQEFDFGSITSITAYQDLEEFSAGDQFPYTAADFSVIGFDGLDGTQSQFFDVKAWSQELRIASKDEDRLRWMFGGYYLDTERFVSTTAGRDTGAGFILPLTRTPFPSDPNNPTTSFLADENDNTAWALFGNLTYDVTDRLEAYFGLRYDEDQREQTVSPLQFGLPAGVGSPGAVNEQTFDSLQPKASLRYKATDNLNLFASWGRGFRSGQFNQNGVGTLVGNAADFADQETTETLEVGFKSQFYDNRFTINGTAYKTDIEDSHYFLFVGAVSAQIMVNIDEVEIQGFDIEATANLAEGFDVYAGLGIIDSEIGAYTFSPGAVGNKAPYVSDSTLNLGGQYRFGLSDGLDGLVRLDYNRTGERFWDPENTTSNDPIDLLNARVALEGGDGKWVASLYAKNLLDTEYNLDLTADGGAVFSFIAPPQVFGVDFRVNF